MTIESIYLAGKIAKNDWRHQVVRDLRYHWGQELQNDGREPPWPVLTEAVGGYLDYTGPYFASDDHGCFHGPTSHGCATCVDGYTPLPRQQVRQRCLNAISRSDMVFAWIDDLTGYGTLVELGVASAFGKLIVIASPSPPDFRCDCGHGCGSACPNRGLGELWFAFSLASKVVRHTDPAACVLELAEDLRATTALAAVIDGLSPIEKSFWNAHQKLALRELAGLVPQHPVGRFFLDFALPGLKIGIELDGFATHSSTADIARDRQRQRAIEAAGWRIIRFGGAEVHRDAAACVQQAAALLAKLIG